MKYIGFFSPDNSKNLNLICSPAGKTKMEYIAQVLTKITGKPEIISPSWTKNRGFHIYSAIRECTPNYNFLSFSTFSVPCHALIPLQWLHSLGQLMAYLYLHIAKSECIIVYHSLYLMIPILVLKKIKKFKLILEVEEIYQDVIKLPRVVEWLERKIVQSADAYILSTKKLAEYIPIEKAYVIVNGSYQLQPRIKNRIHDGMIHCVYAGTLDPTKGGAAAAAAAAYLPKNYHVHILGFGTREEEIEIANQIKRIQKIACCTITFDGLKTGKQYIEFLQTCQIGLCTQIPDAKYVETSFPSKILVYLANGLRVLSVKIPAIEQSDVGDILYYYNKQNPQEIARAIQEIDLSKPNAGRERIEGLDKKFASDFSSMLSHITPY